MHIQFSSVAHHIQLFVTPWTAARQASLSITNSWNLFKLMSIESVIPPNHRILCRPLLLLPSIFPSIRVFSNESALHVRWPKFWSLSFSISSSSEHPGLISFRMDWLDLLAVQGKIGRVLIIILNNLELIINVYWKALASCMAFYEVEHTILICSQISLIYLFAT